MVNIHVLQTHLLKVFMSANARTAMNTTGMDAVLVGSCEAR